MLPQHMELCQSNFDKYIVKLKSDATKNDDNRILFFVFGASHGLMKKGFQTLITNRYDLKTNYYE